MPIFEILYLDDDMKNILNGKENMDKIYEKAVRNGMKKLIEDGILKAQIGLTSLDEIMGAIMNSKINKEKILLFTNELNVMLKSGITFKIIRNTC